MNTKKYNLFALILVLAVLFTACDETLNVEKFEQGTPEISSFEPASGKAGTEITIAGSNLRDVKTATIGGVNAAIRYVISQESVIIVAPVGAKSGVVALSDAKVTVESSESFTVLYPQPAYNTMPVQGAVDADIEIQGTNLDVVTKVLFKDVETKISYQSDKELVVKVPFVADDHVDITLYYANAQGEQSISTTGKVFEIIKPRPRIDGTFPANLTEGESVTITGENLKLIEKILFGDVEAAISRAEATSLTFRVPTLPATATVAVTAPYYEGTAVLNLSDACEVFIPKVFYYPNLMLGAHRNMSFGNMFNASTGGVYTTCVLKETAAQATIDFAAVNNSDHFAINGPHNTLTGLKNYWCDSKTFIKANTLDGLIAEGYGDFVTTRTLFLVLLKSNADQAEIIEKVVAGDITELSPEATPTLFNGTIVADKNTARIQKKSEAEGLENSTVFKVGSVVLFKNEKKNKLGLLYIRQINVDPNQEKAYNDSNGSVVFDVYFQR